MSEKEPTNNDYLIRNFVCSICNKEFSRFSIRKTVPVTSCDDCIRKICATNVSIRDLHKYGINYAKAIKFGWVPPKNYCPLCHKEFRRSNKTQIYCKSPGCISHDFKGRTKTVYKTYTDTGEDPRKIVVCDAMKPVYDKLQKEFPGVVTDDEFDYLRKLVMAELKGRYVKPSGIAVAIFYIIGKKMEGHKKPPQTRICKATGTTEVTLRKYTKLIEKIIEKKDL